MSSLARAKDRIGSGSVPRETDALRRRVVRAGARVDRRTAGVAALAVFLVLPLGLSDGGYFGRSLTALTLALGACAALALLDRKGAPLPSALVVTAVALGLLSAWVALSSLWATPRSGVEPEVRRAALYAVALVAVGVVLDARRRRSFLSALAASVAAVAAVGVVMRVRSGVSLDPYFGSLLEEPVGYPNAMGVLVAIAAVIAIGLTGSAGERTARVLRALAPFLILVLGLSGSRGGALSLAVGLGALVALSERPARWPCAGVMSAAIAIGGAAWLLTMAAGGEGLSLLIAAAGAATIGAATPALGRRGTALLLCGLAVAIAAAVGVQPPSTTSSFRSAYWEAALAEFGEAPLLGSGAGSFYLSWHEHRTVETEVRDAHSLYVETLSELGPVGLALVLMVVATPLVVAVRRRGDAVQATAAAGFVVFAVHAGLDWDWEMPVVTLVALGCAGVVLVGTGAARSKQR